MLISEPLSFSKVTSGLCLLEGFAHVCYFEDMRLPRMQKIAKRNMETYITISKIDSQWEFAVWLRKLKQGLCVNLEG